MKKILFGTEGQNVRNNVFGTKIRFFSEQNSDPVRNISAFFVPNTLFGIIFSEQVIGNEGVKLTTSVTEFRTT